MNDVDNADLVASVDALLVYERCHRYYVQAVQCW